MEMDEGIDTGDILSQRRLAIGPEDTAGSLAAKLSILGADLLLETLPRYLGGELQLQPQDDDMATSAPLIKKGDALLDPLQPAEVLARRVRAFNPRPGAYMLWEGANLKVHRAHAESMESAPGRRLVHLGQPAIATGSGVLVLDEVQPAGKKPMDGRAFLAGVHGWESTGTTDV
jgi:methionyl-tRNA formyltransferase